jgi:hypothetical protein
MREAHDDHLKERYSELTKELVNLYPNFSFRFSKHYTIFGQEVQLFYYEKTLSENRRRASGIMLTFNGNPGDILWNIQNDTKEGILELLRIHNRIGKSTQSFSKTLFKGPMDMGKMEDPRPYIPHHSTPQKRSSEHNNQKGPVYLARKSNEEQPRRIEKPTPVTMEKFKELALKKGWIKEK